LNFPDAKNILNRSLNYMILIIIPVFYENIPFYFLKNSAFSVNICIKHNKSSKKPRFIDDFFNQPIYNSRIFEQKIGAKKMAYFVSPHSAERKTVIPKLGTSATAGALCGRIISFPDL
jgi:hypothetical protein